MIIDKNTANNKPVNWGSDSIDIQTIAISLNTEPDSFNPIQQHP